MTANIYLFKVNKRNTQSRRRSNLFILTSEHYSHHFRVTTADFKQENIYLDSFLTMKLHQFRNIFFKQERIAVKYM